MDGLGNGVFGSKLLSASSIFQSQFHPEPGPSSFNPSILTFFSSVIGLNPLLSSLISSTRHRSGLDAPIDDEDESDDEPESVRSSSVSVSVSLDSGKVEICSGLGRLGLCG